MGTPVPNKNIEDRHAEGSGPVTTRQMTPEELERYGPPAKRPVWMKRGEEGNMSLEEQFNQILTKDRYLELKGRGLSDGKILQEVGLNYNAFIKLLTTKKKEWGVAGLKVNPHPTNESTPENDKDACSGEHSDGDKVIGCEDTFPQAQGENEEQGVTTTYNLAPVEPQVDVDDEILPFIIPRKPSKDTPIVRFADAGLIFNTFACRAMDGVRNIQVTTTKSGKIVIVPSEQGQDCYEMGKWKKNGGSIKIGGGSLVKALKTRGIKFGQYRLEKNETKGWWEAVTQ